MFLLEQDFDLPAYSLAFQWDGPSLADVLDIPIVAGGTVTKLGKVKKQQRTSPLSSLVEFFQGTDSLYIVRVWADDRAIEALERRGLVDAIRAAIDITILGWHPRLTSEEAVFRIARRVAESPSAMSWDRSDHWPAHGWADVAERYPSGAPSLKRFLRSPDP